LFEILKGWRALFAFDDDNITFSIQEEKVKPCEIKKDLRADADG
jgi:hypothetical protein